MRHADMKQQGLNFASYSGTSVIRCSSVPKKAEVFISKEGRLPITDRCPHLPIKMTAPLFTVFQKNVIDTVLMSNRYRVSMRMSALSSRD